MKKTILQKRKEKTKYGKNCSQMKKWFNKFVEAVRKATATI